jgi:hypothetical protein
LKETNTMSPNDSNGILARMHASRRAHRRTTAAFVGIWTVAALLAAWEIASRHTHQPREYHEPSVLCGDLHVPAADAARFAARP